MLNLRELTKSLQDLGTARGQRDVSTLAGRKPSWVSSTIAHRRRPSTSSLVALAFNLRDIVTETMKAAEEAIDQEEKEAYEGGAADLQDWVQKIEAELTRRIENHET